MKAQSIPAGVYLLDLTLFLRHYSCCVFVNDFLRTLIKITERRDLFPSNTDRLQGIKQFLSLITMSLTNALPVFFANLFLCSRFYSSRDFGFCVFFSEVIRLQYRRQSIFRKLILRQQSHAISRKGRQITYIKRMGNQQSLRRK